MMKWELKATCLRERIDYSREPLRLVLQIDKAYHGFYADLCESYLDLCYISLRVLLALDGNLRTRSAYGLVCI